MTFGSKGRHKPDKWRNMLKAAEQQHQVVLQEYQEYLAEQQHLLLKEAILRQIAEGLGAICKCSHVFSCRASPGASDAVPPLAQLSEGRSPQDAPAVVSGAAGEAAADPPGSLSRDNSATTAQTCLQGLPWFEEEEQRGASPGPADSVSSHVTNNREAAVQQLEAAIQEQLSLIEADESSCNGTYFFSTHILQHCLAPENVQKVLSMSVDEVVTQLRHLAGKCALMLLHATEDAAIWDHKEVLVAHMQKNSCSQHQQPAAACQSSAAPGTDLGISAADAAESAEDAGTAAAADQDSLASILHQLHPALEFMTLALTVMLWDEEKFRELVGINLETRQRNFVISPAHWRIAGQKLQLTNDQVATFTLMQQLDAKGMVSVKQQLAEVSRHHGVVMQAKQQETFGRFQSADPDTSMKLEQQAVLKQVLLLGHWRMLGLQQGICTLNCLSLRQLTVFTAASYPCLPHIVMALQAMQTVPANQQQQQNQEQQQLPLPQQQLPLPQQQLPLPQQQPPPSMPALLQQPPPSMPALLSQPKLPQLQQQLQLAEMLQPHDNFWDSVLFEPAA